MNDTETKNVFTTVVVTNERRVQIPTEVLKEINLSEGDVFDIYCNGKLRVRKINKDGRIRVSEPSFTKGATAKISVEDNIIHVSTN